MEAHDVPLVYAFHMYILRIYHMYTFIHFDKNATRSIIIRHKVIPLECCRVYIHVCGL